MKKIAILSVLCLGLMALGAQAGCPTGAAQSNVIIQRTGLGGQVITPSFQPAANFLFVPNTPSVTVVQNRGLFGFGRRDTVIVNGGNGAVVRFRGRRR